MEGMIHVNRNCGAHLVHYNHCGLAWVGVGDSGGDRPQRTLHSMPSTLELMPRVKGNHGNC